MDWNNILTATLSAFFGVNAMYFAISAIGLNVQFGYAGLLNFGQAGFMACGAYAVGMTAHYYHISFWWGIPIAIGYALVFGLIMGVPTLRLRADYLAIVTIALAECLRLIMRSVTFKKYFGGSDGINQFGGAFVDLTPFDPSGKYTLWPFDSRNSTLFTVVLLATFAVSAVLLGRMIAEKWAGEEKNGVTTKWAIASAVLFALILLAVKQTEYDGLSFKSLVVGWVVAAVVGVFVFMLMRSPWGRVIKGIREDEDAVRSLGKNVYSYKMQALLLGGVIATFSGIMFSLSRGSVQPDNYSRDVTFYVLTALVLGGLAKVSGSIVGPMLFWGILQFVDVFLNELTKSWGGTVSIFGVDIITESSHIGVYVQVVIGLMLVFLMVFRPQGLFGNRKEMAIDGH
jgi:branched-chain amino acid transport system permease protein